VTAATDSKRLEYDEAIIAIIGLGYVGLPLAVEFGKHRRVIGFDVSAQRIADLRDGKDVTREVSKEGLGEAVHLELSSDETDLKDADIYIVTVPTPVDEAKRPDLQSLISASKTVGAALSEGNIVIYESTVYPGATEETCVPTLEASSSLRYNQDFYCGYSPERINPGDKKRRLPDIVKVTSGSTSEIAEVVDALYRQIISAGTFKAQSIKVAEAAKVIENTQRDVNIALINELSMLFDVMGIDTQAVLAAAETKWNFLPFKPGLVGGHCIGVDPYYLTHRAEQLGFDTRMVLSGREINDGMPAYVADKIVQRLHADGVKLDSSRVLILGATFKEDCPDIRNSKVFDLIDLLGDCDVSVDVFDPWIGQTSPPISSVNFLRELPVKSDYDAIVVAVAHKEFRDMGVERIRALARVPKAIFDLKGVLPSDQTAFQL
jgi:UDP-N-acetyl-D-glucosamine/UDP-N-acetyl-D-galactosamine dehydrogenase